MTAKATQSEPRKVQLTVVLTPEGLEKAEGQLASLKARFRRRGRRELKNLADEVRTQNAGLNAKEVLDEIEETVREVREDMRREQTSP